MRTVNLLISGRVQGVGFRWFTQKEAQKRHIQGYVRNLSDGRVEVEVHGDADAIDDLIDSLYSGPPSGRVDEISINELARPSSDYDSFSITY